MAMADDQGPKRRLFADSALPVPGIGERSFWVGLVIVVASVVSGFATFLILTGLTPVTPRPEVVGIVLSINVLLVLAMAGVIAYQAHGLRRAWVERIAGARLFVRVVALFSLIAALPALSLTVAATTSFSRALDGVFSRQTRDIIGNSLDVANAYLEEHGQVIRTDIVNMAKDLDDAAAGAGRTEKGFRDLVFAQAGLRDLPLAYVIDRTGAVKIAAVENDKIPYIRPPLALIQAAASGQVPLLMPLDTNRVAALTQLAKYPDRFLYVARGVNPIVLSHLRRTQAGVAEYEAMRERRGGLKFVHGLLYFMTSMTAMLSAIWVGIWFADRLVAPIRRLISAARQVAKGDLKIELPIRRGEGDLRRLSMDFNHMTQQLDRQRSDLMTANAQLTERRRFTEAVLSGVSAGVIGLDATERVTLANTSAETLLGKLAHELAGARLADVVPEFATLLEETRDPDRRNRAQQYQVAMLVGGVERSLAVKVTRAPGGDDGDGAVVTFDDVTEIVSAQRTSAWADIARRIAHEIKNPLTPIQLSAERIRRKYSHVIKEDREVFDKCTETIIRQVGDVARMVDEFSSFARMPKAEMADIDLRDPVREAVTLYQMGSTGLDIVMDLPKERLELSADRRLLSQALTNLVKNAIESVQAVADAKDKPVGFKGRVETRVRRTGNAATIEVIDNGVGLPKQGRARLLEPYVTTKGAKGTGLGLAIVQKIIEQHGGTLTLEDAPVVPGRERGALMRVTLPIAATRPAAKPTPADETAPPRAAAGAA